MFDVLVYLIDRTFEKDIQEMFDGENCRIIAVDSRENLISACLQDFVDLILIWPAEYTEVKETLAAMSENKLEYIPVIAVNPGAAQLPELAELPIAEVLETPLPKRLFIHKLRNVLDDVEIHSRLVEGVDWEGKIEEYDLLDLLQMIEISDRDAELQIHYSNFEGLVIFHQGKVINASFGDLRGLPALEKMAILPVGFFRSHLTQREDVNDYIKMDNHALQIHLMEKQFKAEELMQELPGFAEEVMTNPLVEIQNVKPLYQKVIDACRQPLPLLDVLFVLEESVEDILPVVNSLFASGRLGLSNEVQELIRKEEERSGFEKIFDSVSSIFKRKSVPELDYTNYTVTDSNETVQQIDVSPARLTPDEQQAAYNKLQELLK